MKKFVSVLLSLLTLIFLAVPAYGQSESKKLNILFSHDMHSYIDEKADGTGGFARIKTLINQYISDKSSETLVVDGGDFSMGTLYQTVFSTEAVELRLLGLLGYDAVTLGNHEFDYGADGLAKMLNSAKQSGDILPELLIANIDWENSTGEYTDMLKSALDDYGYQRYTIIQKGNIKIGLFGLIGADADACAPNSGLEFNDINETADDVVKEMIKKDNPDIIVCLSHSGTSEDSKKSEDEILAKNVPDIDIIISGHTHSTLKQPIICGNTAIMSAGEYASNLGEISLTQREDGSWNIDNYELISLDESVTPDTKTLEIIESFQNLTSDYLKNFGYSNANQILAYNPYDFVDMESIYHKHTEHTLGNLLSDSFIYAVKKAEGESGEKVDFAVVPNGIIRSIFTKGEITASRAFEALSLGIGPDGIPGYPLISVYLTGKEIKTACEIDASVSELMEGTMLFFSGLSFTFNPNRILLNKVTDVKIVDEQGNTSELSDDKLYRIVADLYSGQMLGAVNDVSYGLLSLVPKDKDGNPITDFKDHIIYKDGTELKAWCALADYLQSFEKQNGLSTVPEKYSHTEGRKIVDDNKNFFEIIKNPNKTTFIIYGVILLLVLIIVVVILLIIRIFKKKKARKAKELLDE